MVRFRAVAFAALLATTGSTGAVNAASTERPPAFDAATTSEIQSVIIKQLDALQHDDGTAAEAFAAPGIKDKFPEPSAFLAMVKEHYGALIHPKSTSFGEVVPSPHGPLQKMTIVSADGVVWTAIYSFEKVDGAWRISACGLAKDETQQAI